MDALGQWGDDERQLSGEEGSQSLSRYAGGGPRCTQGRSAGGLRQQPTVRQDAGDPPVAPGHGQTRAVNRVAEGDRLLMTPRQGEVAHLSLQGDAPELEVLQR